MLYIDHIDNDTFYVVDTEDLSYEIISRDNIIEAVNSGLDIKNLQGVEYYPYRNEDIAFVSRDTAVIKQNIFAVWFRGYFYLLEDNTDDEYLHINKEATPFGSMYSWNNIRSIFKKGDSLFITLYNHSIEFTNSGLAIITLRKSKSDDEDDFYTTKIKSPVVESKSKRKVIQGVRKPLAYVKSLINRG